eukprot:750797-Hanusia_phi.AAC.1
MLNLATARECRQANTQPWQGPSATREWLSEQPLRRGPQKYRAGSLECQRARETVRSKAHIASLPSSTIPTRRLEMLTFVLFLSVYFRTNSHKARGEVQGNFGGLCGDFAGVGECCGNPLPPQVLSDPQKRRQYDLLGEAAVDIEVSLGAVDMEQMTFGTTLVAALFSKLGAPIPTAIPQRTLDLAASFEARQQGEKIAWNSAIEGKVSTHGVRFYFGEVTEEEARKGDDDDDDIDNEDAHADADDVGDDADANDGDDSDEDCHHNTMFMVYEFTFTALWAASSNFLASTGKGERRRWRGRGEGSEVWYRKLLSQEESMPEVLGRSGTFACIYMCAFKSLHVDPPTSRFKL